MKKDQGRDYDLSGYWNLVQEAKHSADEERRHLRETIAQLTYFPDAKCNEQFSDVRYWDKVLDESQDLGAELKARLFEQKINVVGFEILNLLKSGCPKHKVCAKVIENFGRRNVSISPAYVRRLCKEHQLTESKYANRGATKQAIQKTS